MSDGTAISGWERAALAAEKVRERLLRSTAALERAGIPYAVAGGNAVAEWVGRVDEDAVRNTRDVDILIRRADLPAVKKALESAGFVYVHSFDVDMFLDGPEGRPTSAVHLLFAGEKVKPSYSAPSPDVAESEAAATYRVVALNALVRMKLLSFRDRDRMHLRDLVAVGLVDRTWLAQLPQDLAARLQELLDDPEG